MTVNLRWWQWIGLAATFGFTAGVTRAAVDDLWFDDPPHSNPVPAAGWFATTPHPETGARYACWQTWDLNTGHTSSCDFTHPLPKDD